MRSAPPGHGEKAEKGTSEESRTTSAMRMKAEIVRTAEGKAGKEKQEPRSLDRQQEADEIRKWQEAEGGRQEEAHRKHEQETRRRRWS